MVSTMSDHHLRWPVDAAVILSGSARLPLNLGPSVAIPGHFSSFEVFFFGWTTNRIRELTAVERV